MMKQKCSKHRVKLLQQAFTKCYVNLTCVIHVITKNNNFEIKKIVSYLLLITILYSCRPDIDYTISGYTQKIVVEGNISNGEYPKVYLTLNVPLSHKIDSINILKNVIRTAKVVISDGINTEILTSSWESDKRFFPPYKYFGTDLKGEEGKTYYLTVVYSGYTLHAQTTIPYKTNVVKFDISPIEGNESLRKLFMTININSSRKNSYRVFTKKRKDGYFKETQVLFNSEFSLSGNNKFVISPNVTKLDPSYSEGAYFAKGDSIEVRLCTIDSVATQFFKALTLFSSSSGIGNNFFIGEKDALQSNISLPGFGIWYGNGVSSYNVIIP